jgi:hypothetical protein
MFCPNCKCEYLAGVTQCSDCGVPLVSQLDAESSFSLSHGSITRVWSGTGSPEFTAVKAALESASIEYKISEPAEYFFVLTAGPKMEIWVSNDDAERAKKVLLEREEQIDLTEFTDEEMKSLELPAKDDPETDSTTIILDDTSEDWDDEQPVSEVWKGGEEDFANTLTACFRENGIQSHKVAEGDRWRLVVRPQQEARAKEIVREVVEARPSE